MRDLGYATYSQACLGDDHHLCFDTECDCQCHEDADEALDAELDAAAVYDRSWGY